MTFEAFYAQYARYVYAICLRQMRDPGVADDLAQETWLHAWHMWDRNRPSQAWVGVLAANRCRMAWRARYTQVRRFGIVQPYDPRTDPRRVPGPDAALLAAERHAALLARLTPPQRRALALRAAGHDLAAIAAHLGTNENAVKQLLHRARATLRSVAQ